MKIKLSIQNRKTLGNHDLHVVKNQDEKSIYCQDIVLISNVNGYRLLNNKEEIALKNHDKLITHKHIVEVTIEKNEKNNIQYNETRAPSTNLSQIWGKPGLEVLTPSETNFNESILPTSYSQHEKDPLDFLISNNRHRDDRLSLEKSELKCKRTSLLSHNTESNSEIPNPLLSTDQKQNLSQKITEYPTTEYENTLLLNKKTNDFNQREKISSFRKIGTKLKLTSK